MLDTKAMIVTQILKLTGPFKARHVWEPLGLTTQNTGNHLSRLVSKGVLTKRGQMYEILDKERLIDELITASEGPKMEKPVDVLGLSFTSIHKKVDQIVRARVLDIEDAPERHIEMNHSLDEMTEQLKLLKKWLNNKSYTLSRAEKGFDRRAWFDGDEVETRRDPEPVANDPEQVHYYVLGYDAENNKVHGCKQCGKRYASKTQFIETHHTAGLKYEYKEAR